MEQICKYIKYCWYIGIIITWQNDGGISFCQYVASLVSILSQVDDLGWLESTERLLSDDHVTMVPHSHMTSC